MANIAKPAANQLQALVDTVEVLRKNKFPLIDSALVREILAIHADGGASETEMSKAADVAVEAHLAKEA